MKIESIGTGGNCQALIAKTRKCDFLITHADGPDLPVDNQEYRIGIYRKNKALEDEESIKTLYFKKFNSKQIEEKLEKILSKL